MSEPIHLTVAAVIFRNGRYLLVREQIAEQLVYNQPAGHVENGETLSEAMLREALEETGHQVELTGLLGLSTYYSASANITYYRVSFAARLTSSEERRPLDPEIIDTCWLTYEEVAKQSSLRSPMVLSDIERHRSGKVFPMDLLSEFSSGTKPT